MKHLCAILLSLTFVSGCGQTGVQNAASPPSSAPLPAEDSPSKIVNADTGPWELAYEENFESLCLPTSSWLPAAPGTSDAYDDAGSYFTERGGETFASSVPASFRSTTAFGRDGWLTAESSTRDGNTDPKALLSVEPDPANENNHTLRLASPRHSDSTVIRPSWALPAEYKICVRGGFADFGTGYESPGANGYRGDESARPWRDMPATHENGLYWLAILDAVPGPHNNVWIHHHRKAVIDSDNHWYSDDDGGPWCSIWNGNRFVPSGVHPVMMFVLDPQHHAYPSHFDRSGAPFISWAAGQWNYEAVDDRISAADAYREREWYDACITKTATSWRLTMTGRFRHSGDATLGGTISRDLTMEQAGTPDYFMFGDPHVNFYTGLAYYDDLRLYLRPGTSWPAAAANP